VVFKNFADVCLPVRISATASRNLSFQLENLTLKPAPSPIAVRVPLSGTSHRATPSTRIPVLSIAARARRTSGFLQVSLSKIRGCIDVGPTGTWLAADFR
jgi:hypothetical protein